MDIQNRSDFFNSVSIEFAHITKCDIMYINELLEHGKQFVLGWLKDEALRDHFKNDAMMYYYNISCIAFAGGILYADAWEKDITQIKLGTVDTLLASQTDIMSVAYDVLGIQNNDKNMRLMLDTMFEKFLNLLEPYWDKEDPRPFLFQGVLAFLEAGISYRLKK